MARVLGAAVLAVFLVIASTALAIWWTARKDSRPSSDAIVVLGTAQYNGVPSSFFEARLEHAIALYEDGVAPVIVTVGGKLAGDEFTEAEAGRAYLAESGIPDDALLAVDPASRVAVETLITTGQVHLAGEVTTTACAPIAALVRIGFDRVYIHHVGKDQQRFVARCADELLPRLREAL